MGTMANSEYPDEMLHKGAFHKGLQCFLRQNRSSEKGRRNYNLWPLNIYIGLSLLDCLNMTIAVNWNVEPQTKQELYLLDFYAEHTKPSNG